MVVGLLGGFLSGWMGACISYWEDHGSNLIDATVNFWLGK